MKALTYIEIDVPVCQLTFGVAPCTATGDKKCFNSRATCKDLANIDEETVTMRFAIDNGFLPVEIEAIPSLMDVSFSPATIRPGETLGERASCNATFADHFYSDTATGFDKYFDERDYDPYKQGTFWAKFRARQPYIRGKRMRVIRGYVPATFSQEYPFGEPLPAGVLDRQDVRNYVIENFNGATPDGKFTISARDILKIADGDRAQAPRLSSGRILADVASTANTFTLTPSGAGDEEYPAFGYLNLGGKEIVRFARDPYSGLNANTELLMHFDGANNATVMTDSSGKTRNGTVVGNAKLTTASKRYGPSCLILDGAGDYVNFADNAAWTPAGDFTIDCWALFDDFTRQHTICSHSSNADANMYRLYVTAAGALCFDIISGGGALLNLASAAAEVAAGSFEHISVERFGNVWTLYVNGVPVDTTISSVVIPNFTSNFRIGASGTVANNQMKGQIDEFRFQSQAFWQGDFSEELPGSYAANGDVVSIDRGYFSTLAQDHKAQDRAQLCLEYTSDNVAEIVADLLVNYASCEPEFIPFEDWETEVGLYHNQVYSAMIAEPTAVKTLLDELIQQAQLAMWQDDASQQIQLRVLKPVSPLAPVISDEAYLKGSFQSVEQLDRRVSHVWTYFGQRNPLEKLDKTDNYRSSDLVINSESLTNYEAPAIKKIYSRWIPEGGRAVASKMGDVILSRLAQPPRKFMLKTWKTGSILPELGGHYFVSAPTLQDDTGAQIIAPVIITRLDPNDTEFGIEAEEAYGGSEPVDLINRVIPIEADTLNVNVLALHNSIYQPLTDEDVANGVNLTIRVNSGVRVGSTNILNAAIDFGDADDWPLGFQITLEIYGDVKGKGGRGGRGGTGTSASTAGENGGLAIRTRFPIKVRRKAGSRIAGGGGGGGGSGAALFGAEHIGGAGGGGAGHDPGDGGAWPFTGNPTLGAKPGGDEVGGDGGHRSGQGYPGPKGGNIGQAGPNGQGNIGGVPASNGGQPGAAIDGVSYCTMLETNGDLLGPTIN